MASHKAKGVWTLAAAVECAHLLYWVLGLAVALYGLHRLALWLEQRGWLYYLNRRPRGSSGSFAVSVASAVDPTIRHIVETHRALAENPEVDESGEGPEEPPPE